MNLSYILPLNGVLGRFLLPIKLISSSASSKYATILKSNTPLNIGDYAFDSEKPKPYLWRPG